MQIGRDFRIESDELNVVILERHVAETGKTAGQETYKPIKYYGKLEDALDCLVTLRINGIG